MGLVDELQPDELLLDRSLEAAAALAALPRTAYSQVKRQLRETRWTASSGCSPARRTRSLRHG